MNNVVWLPGKHLCWKSFSETKVVKAFTLRHTATSIGYHAGLSVAPRVPLWGAAQ